MLTSKEEVDTCLQCRHMGANLHVYSMHKHTQQVCVHKYTSPESVYFPSSRILMTPLASLRDQYNISIIHTTSFRVVCCSLTHQQQLHSLVWGRCHFQNGGLTTRCWLRLRLCRKCWCERTFCHNRWLGPQVSLGQSQ